MKSLSSSPILTDIRRYAFKDFSAGIVVFLVAVPLCLGIAMASDAPLFSGLVAGVVGGLIVSLISGSEISVSGPAAGLAVIVSGAIASLGSFEDFLLAVVLSGIIQLVFAFLRGGIIGNYFPTSVIKGMLAGIGVVIALKQIPHALGRDLNFEGDLSFINIGGEGNTFGDILIALYTFSPGAVVISSTALVLLFIWESPSLSRYAFFRLVPSGLVVVLLGVLFNEFFAVFVPSWTLRAETGHLVSLPVPEGVTDLVSYFVLPNYGAISRSEVWVIAATIAVIGSLETLLSVEAADKIDPLKRLSNPNKELMSQGVGNILSGMLGGLPITAVIVRSSANVYAGGRTRMSGFWHGLFLLLAVLFFPVYMNKIPLACLSAILIAVGYKLASVKLFKAMQKVGNAYFIPFLVTLLAIVFTDLLIGISIGLIVGLVFVLRANIHSAISVAHHENDYVLRFKKDISFAHKAELKKVLFSLPDNIHLTIDATKAMFIDQDIYEVIEDFTENAKQRGIIIEYRNFHSISYERLIRNPFRRLWKRK